VLHVGRRGGETVRHELSPFQKVRLAAYFAFSGSEKAIRERAGLAELSIFYCEEAFSFLESCAIEDERYFIALISMYDQAAKRVLDLPAAERHAYAKRLAKLKTRARPVGCGIGDELNSIWYEAGLDEY
jgi:hypothetical protein